MLLPTHIQICISPHVILYCGGPWHWAAFLDGSGVLGDYKWCLPESIIITNNNYRWCVPESIIINNNNYKWCLPESIIINNNNHKWCLPESITANRATLASRRSSRYNFLSAPTSIKQRIFGEGNFWDRPTWFVWGLSEKFHTRPERFDGRIDRRRRELLGSCSSDSRKQNPRSRRQSQPQTDKPQPEISTVGFVKDSLHILGVSQKFPHGFW